MKTAVIDMGSNTFHLLIAEKRKDSTPNIIFKERSFVHLARNGLGFLDAPTLLRAKEALQNFSSIIQTYQVQETILVGTAALRSASNISDFEEIIQDLFHQELQVISGEKEAKYIYQGVYLAAEKNIPDSVIMDIGGGSVEFIVTKSNQPIWSKSYPVGISALISKFNPSDPITGEEKKLIYDYLSKECLEVLEILSEVNIHSLTGSSGTFEVFAENVNKTELTPHFWQLDLKGTEKLLNDISQMTLQERENFPGFPSWRAALMPSAVVLIQWAIEKMKIETLYYSNYALKEGMLEDLTKG